MRPQFTLANLCNGDELHSERICNLALRESVVLSVTSYHPNIYSRELGSTIALACMRAGSSLFGAVSIVISLRPKEKMIGIDTFGVVATMEDAHGRRHISKKQDIRNNVRSKISPADAKLSVATLIAICSSPLPTPIAIKSHEVWKESLEYVVRKFRAFQSACIHSPKILITKFGVN
jgi:hypothetical protein